MLIDEQEVTEFILNVQQGEYQLVKEALRRKPKLALESEKDGCTGLHWAALNNRLMIANLLIDCGADINKAGGFLEESPLQWALRRRYYGMADLLMRKGKKVFAFKSSQSFDALTLCQKLRDPLGYFLCLHRGADPNISERETGNSRLLALLKTKRGASVTFIEYARLLLQFGADVTKADFNGYTSLHALADSADPVNLYLAFEIYQRFGPTASSVKNKEGYTAYNLATNNRNRKMVSFLYDALLYNFFPYYTPTVAVAASLCTGFFLVSLYGLLFGPLCWAVCHFLSFRLLVQFTIIHHRSRLTLGIFVGVFISTAFEYCVYVMPTVSTMMNVLTFGSAVLLAVSTFAFQVTPAISWGHGSDIPDLVAKILASSPKEGTYKEIVQARRHASKVIKGSGSGGESADMSPRLLNKDRRELEITERLMESLKSIKRPPILCAVCLHDRHRCSSHCRYCGRCIVDRHLHVDFLGVCAGRGNMRLLLFVMLSAILSCAAFIVASLYAQVTSVCPDSLSGSRTGTIHLVWSLIMVQICVIARAPVLAICTYISIVGFVVFLLLENQFMSMIVFETTIWNIVRGRYPPERRLTLVGALFKIWNFVSTGVHTVTVSGKRMRQRAAIARERDKSAQRSGDVEDETESLNIEDDADADTLLIGDRRSRGTRGGESRGTRRGDSREERGHVILGVRHAEGEGGYTNQGYESRDPGSSRNGRYNKVYSILEKLSTKGNRAMSDSEDDEGTVELEREDADWRDDDELDMDRVAESRARKGDVRRRRGAHDSKIEEDRSAAGEEKGGDVWGDQRQQQQSGSDGDSEWDEEDAGGGRRREDVDEETGLGGLARGMSIRARDRA